MPGSETSPLLVGSLAALAFEHGQVAQAILDLSGPPRLREVNDALARLVGRSRDDLLDVEPSLLVREHDRPAVRDLLVALAAARSGTRTIETRCPRPDGTAVRVSVTASAFDVGGPHVVLEVHDLTPRYEAQRSRRLAARQLAQHAGAQEALAKLGEDALSDLDTSAFLERGARRVRQAADADLCGILRVGESGLDAQAIDCVVPDLERSVAAVVPPNSQSAYTLSIDDPVVVEDWGRETRFRRSPLLAALGARSGVSLPIRTKSETHGVLGLQDRRPRWFGPEAIRFLEAAAHLLALGLEFRSNERELRNSNAKVQRAWRETLGRLAHAIELRDERTGQHIVRMARYCELTAARLGVAPERRRLLRLAAPMHDAGKVGLPDSILLKPGKLTQAERELMQTHATLGHDLLAGSGNEILDLAATVALTHHEWIDGSGYPRGLVGDAIPLEGRIAAVADVYDALTTDRPYRPAMTHEHAIALMREGRGTHFDPAVLDALLAVVDAEAAPATPEANAA